MLSRVNKGGSYRPSGDVLLRPVESCPFGAPERLRPPLRCLDPSGLPYGMLFFLSLLSQSSRVSSFTGSRLFFVNREFRSGRCFEVHASKSFTTSSSSFARASVRSTCVADGRPSYPDTL